MEDFLKFLLIAGVILVGIFKEVNKNSKAKKAKAKHPVPPMPSPVEVNPYPKRGAAPNPWTNCSGRFLANNRLPNNFPNSKLRNKKRKKKKYPWLHLLQTALHKMNGTVGKVLITTLPTTHPTIKKILRFIRQKKLAEPLSGEKYFNGNIEGN